VEENGGKIAPVEVGGKNAEANGSFFKTFAEIDSAQPPDEVTAVEEQALKGQKFSAQEIHALKEAGISATDLVENFQIKSKFLILKKNFQ
jgi:hypothetical protein